MTDLTDRSSGESYRGTFSNSVNTKDIVCAFCGSKVLKANVCSFVDKSFPLPHMKIKNGESLNNQVEYLSEYWMVDNMMTFENVGFSHNVGTIKYLACADCEVGPIGFHDTQAPKEFFIAASRIKYSEM